MLIISLKFRWLLPLFLFIGPSNYAQTSVIDTSETNKKFLLAKKLKSKNQFDKSLVLLDTVIKEYRSYYGKVSFKELIARRLKSDSYLDLAQFDNCYKEIQFIEKNLEKVDDLEKELWRKLQFTVAGFYAAKGNYKKSNETIETALKLEIQRKDTNEILTLNTLLGDNKMRQRDYDSAEQILKKNISLGDHDNQKVIASKATLAKIFRRQNKYLEAHTLIDEVINATKDSLVKAGAFNNKALCFKNQGKLKDAIEYYKKAMSYYKGTYKIEYHKSYNSINHNFGNVYKRLNQYDLAIQYCKTAIKGRIKVEGEISSGHALSQYSLSLVYYEIGLFDLAVKHGQIAVDIYNQLYPPNHGALIQLKSYLNGVIKHLNKGEGSDIFVDQVEKNYFLFKNNYPTQRIEIFDLGSNLVQWYSSTEQYEKAEILFEELNLMLDSIPKLSIIAKLKYYRYQSHFFNQIGNYQKSYYYINKSLEENNFSVASFEDVISIDQALRALKLGLLASTQEYVLNKREKDLDLALDYSQNSLKFFDYLRSNFINEQNSFNANYLWYEHYERIIDIQYQLKSLKNDSTIDDIIFNLHEKCKANKLLANMKSDYFLNSININPDFRKNFKKNTGRIKKLKDKLANADPLNFSIKDSLQNLLFIANTEKEKLKNQLKISNPQFYEYVYQNQPVDLNHLKKVLQKNNQALISYFLGPTRLFISSIYNGKISNRIFPFKVRNTKILDLEEISKITDGNFDYKTLYKEILKQEIDSFDDNISSLIIIPDGTLNYIPFEALQNSKDQYLVESFDISYAYSATWLEKLGSLKSDAAESMLCFVPTYENANHNSGLLAELSRSDKHNLPGAKKEIEEISKIIHTGVIEGFDATERKFRSNLNNHKILHLAMHADLGTESSNTNLLFSDAKDSIYNNNLSIDEIKGLKINADLVVLSACNTGMGEIEQGAGAMSLSKAFALAGVPSTIMSLWKVPDESTSYIMIEFYKNLKNGLKKDESLRQAKLCYINDSTIPEALKTPYHWAGFVAVGNMNPVNISDSHLIYWILAGVSLFILSLLLINKRKT